MPRRRRLCTLLAALACLPLATFGQNPKTDLVVWGPTLGPDSKGFEAIVRGFEKRNPQYRVRLLSMGAGNMNPQKLMTAIVGKVPPDAIHQDRFTVSDWASRGAFRSLNDLIERDKGTDPTTPTADKYFPATWNEATWKGQVYGVPTGADDRVLYYNKEVFREKAGALRSAGLDPDRPPRTWSELLAYSRVLTEKRPDGTLNRVGFIPNYGNSWLYIYAFQNDAPLLSPDGRTCWLATPPVVEALEFVVEGYKIVGGYEEAGKFQTTVSVGGGENDPFIKGRIAMKIDGEWIIPGIARFAPDLDFGTAPAPVPDDRYFRRGRFKDTKDTFVTWSGGYCWAIPRGARNVEGAWRWIKWAQSVEANRLGWTAQRDWERRRGRQLIIGMQASKELTRVARTEFIPSDPKFAKALGTHFEMQPYSRWRPATFAAQVLWNEHVRALERAAMLKLTPLEALRQGQAVVQKEIDAVYNESRYPVIDMRIPGWIGLGGAILGLILFYVYYKSQPLGRLGRHEARWGYITIFPWVFGFLVFTLGPMLASLFFSFTQYNVLNDARWVGLKNYIDLRQDEQGLLVKSFANILYLGGIGVPLGLVTGLAIGLLLNADVRGMRYFRTAFYLPSIVPGVASVFLWLWILNPDPNRGLLNGAWQATITQWLAIPPPGWLGVEAWARPSLIVMGLWGAGGGMLLWLAGLKGISTTFYEAAAVDGATPSQQFWNITLPQISPIVFFNVIMGLIGSVQQFESQYLATGGGNAGPGDSLLTPVYHLFNNAFGYFKMGYASALAWTMFAIILVLTIFQLKIAPRWVHYEVEK